jgi:hypothetical protein
MHIAVKRCLNGKGKRLMLVREMGGKLYVLCVIVFAVYVLIVGDQLFSVTEVCFV